MALLPRRVKPPAALRKLLDPDERILAVADVAGSPAVVATQRGLWLPVAGADTVSKDLGPGWRRVDWDQVVKATWSEDGLHVIEGVADEQAIVTDLPEVTVRFSDARNLPTVVRTRVESSIGRWEQVKVPGGTGRLVGRRTAGVDGLRWTARLDTGTPNSPGARAALVDYLCQVARMTPEQLFPGG